MDELDVLKRVGDVPALSEESFARTRQLFEDRAVGLDAVLTPRRPAAAPAGMHTEGLP